MNDFILIGFLLYTSVGSSLTFIYTFLNLVGKRGSVHFKIVGFFFSTKPMQYKELLIDGSDDECLI